MTVTREDQSVTAETLTGVQTGASGTITVRVTDPLGKIATVGFNVKVTLAGGDRTSGPYRDDAPAAISPGVSTYSKEVLLDESGPTEVTPVIEFIDGSPTLYGDAAVFGTRGTDQTHALLNFREVERTSSEVPYRWSRGSAVAEVWIYDSLVTQPIPSDPWPGEGSTPTAVLTTENEYTCAVPPRGSVRYLQFEPRSESLVAGPVQRVVVFPVDAPPIFEYVRQPNGSSVGTTDLYVRIRDPKSCGGTLSVWTRRSAHEDADFTAAPDATLLIASTPIEVGPAQLTALDDIVVHPGRGKRIYLEFVNSEGVSTGIRGELLHGWSNLVTLADELRDAAVTRTTIVDGAVNDLKLASLAVTTANLADEAVNAAKIAVASITTTRIADDAISTPKLQASAITSGKIEAGAITAGKIAAGAINATNLIANGIITGDLIAGGTITGAKILAGSITGDRIQANTITGDRISANSISGDRIIAGTIDATRISVTDLSAINANFTGVVRVTASGPNSIQFFNGTNNFANINAVVTSAYGDTIGMTVGANSVFVSSDGMHLHGNIQVGVTGAGTQPINNLNLQRSNELRFGDKWMLRKGTDTNANLDLMILGEGYPRFYFADNGNAYADTGWNVFSPDPPKPAEAMTVSDWLSWGVEDAKKPVKPYDGLPGEDHPFVVEEARRSKRGRAAVAEAERQRYAKDISKIAIGSARALDALFQAALQARDFEHFCELLSA
jgi:hypothetical protein